MPQLRVPLSHLLIYIWKIISLLSQSMFSALTSLVLYKFGETISLLKHTDPWLCLPQ